MNKLSMGGAPRPANSTDIRKILGDLDDAKVAEILELKPSLADLEDTAIRLAGDEDLLARSGHRVPATASRIVELLAEEEAEPER